MKRYDSFRIIIDHKFYLKKMPISKMILKSKTNFLKFDNDSNNCHRYASSSTSGTEIAVIKMEATRTLSELRSEHRDIRLNFKVFAISNVDIPLKS